MPVYHIVLFKLKPSIASATDSPSQFSTFATAAKSMVGQIPGLLRIDVGPPLSSTAHRAQGYDMGLVAVLEKAEDVAVYAAHPAHGEVHKLREELCTETLAFDLEF